MSQLLRCCYCLDGVRESLRNSRCGCGAVLHWACWSELGRCPTLGCPAAHAGTPLRLVREPPRPPGRIVVRIPGRWERLRGAVAEEARLCARDARTVASAVWRGARAVFAFHADIVTGSIGYLRDPFSPS